MLFDPSDKQLIQQIARGHEDSFEALYARHGLTLLTYLLQQLDDRSLAEEVLQDVMVDVWKGAAKFRGESAVLTWMFSIARYRAIRVRRYRPQYHCPIDDKLPATENEPEAATEVIMRSSDVQRAIAQLSLEHREVLDLMFFYELSGNEGAEVLGIALGTFKSRLSRAKAAVHKLLREEA